MLVPRMDLLQLSSLDASLETTYFLYWSQRISKNVVYALIQFLTLAFYSHFYQFCGSVPANSDPPFLQNIFLNSSGQFQDMPGDLGFSKLDLYFPKDMPLPEIFAWLTGIAAAF